VEEVRGKRMIKAAQKSEEEEALLSPDDQRQRRTAHIDHMEP